LADPFDNRFHVKRSTKARPNHDSPIRISDWSLAGLRSLTPPAATAWAAHLGWLKLQRPLSWMSTAPAAVIFALVALLELVSDKLPKTPRRTAPPSFIARILLDALTGPCVAIAAAQENWTRKGVNERRRHKSYWWSMSAQVEFIRSNET
jgi:hypothetical protein